MKVRHPESRGSAMPRRRLAAVALALVAVLPIQKETATQVSRQESAPAKILHLDHAQLAAQVITISQIEQRLVERIVAGAEAPPTTTTLPVPTTTAAPLTPEQIAENNVTPEDMTKWSKVNVCEEDGNWHTPSGGLGITPPNWIAFGGQEFAPSGGLASPIEQVYIAKKILKSITGSDQDVPDQNGCSPDGW
jgi:transglycosylase-like protein